MEVPCWQQSGSWVLASMSQLVRARRREPGRRSRSFRTDQQGTWTGLSDCNERPVLFSRRAGDSFEIEMRFGPMDTHKAKSWTEQEGSGTSVA